MISPSGASAYRVGAVDELGEADVGMWHADSERNPGGPAAWPEGGIPVSESTVLLDTLTVASDAGSADFGGGDGVVPVRAPRSIPAPDGCSAVEGHYGSVESAHITPVTELGHSDSVGVGAFPDVVICTHALGAHVVRGKKECTMGSREECGLAVVDHCVVISDD